MKAMYAKLPSVYPLILLYTLTNKMLIIFLHFKYLKYLCMYKCRVLPKLFTNFKSKRYYNSCAIYSILNSSETDYFRF